jgi:hypothetical protein
MITRLLKNKDFWAGMMFIGFGAAAMSIARDYRFGSAMRMGPGFFPTILGGILIAFGVCIMAVGLGSGEKIQERLSIRALVLLPLSLILFGLLMQWAGFIPALVVLIFMSAASGKGFHFLEVLMLTGILVVAAVALFIWGLGLPFPLFKGF